MLGEVDCIDCSPMLPDEPAPLAAADDELWA